MASTRHRWLFVAGAVCILVTGLALRLVGIRHGEPDVVYHPDVIKQALVTTLVYGNTLDIKERFGSRFTASMYPYGTSVLLGNLLYWNQKIFDPDNFDGGWATHAKVWRWALRQRYFATTLMLIAASIFMLSERKRMMPAYLILTSCLLVWEPINAQFSHYGMNDVPLASMLILSWLSSARMTRERWQGLAFALLTGLCLGLAFGIKYQGILGLAFPGVAWLITFTTTSWARRIGVPLLVAGGWLAGALFACPQLRDFPYFLEWFPQFMAWQTDLLGMHHTWQEKAPRNIQLFIRFGLQYGYWLGLFPFAWSLRRALDTKEDAGLRVLLAGASLFTGGLVVLSIVSRDLIRSNDMVCLTPFLLLPMGYMLTQIHRSGPYVARATLTSATIILVTFYGVCATLDSLALARTDTRVLAAAWARENLPRGSRVIREFYTLPIKSPDIMEERPHSLKTSHARRLIVSGDYDILIVSSLNYERYFDPLSPQPLEYKAYYEDLMSSHSPLATFEDRALFFAHPRITVYGRRD